MEEHQIQILGAEQRKGNPIIEYFRGAFVELRKVTWPSRRETWKKSWIVIGFSLSFALFLGAIDYGLNRLLEVIF